MSFKKTWIIPYVIFITIVAVLVSYAAFFSSAARAQSFVNPEAQLDNLDWVNGTPPASMSLQWEKSGYDDLLSSPGSMIGVRGSTVERLNSYTGDPLWSYGREDAKICDVIAAGSTVYALFNPGHGCSDIIALDSATGQRKAQAQYGTKSDVARLVYGRDTVAIATPNNVRVVRASDLVPKALFGDDPTLKNAEDQEVKDCTVSDVVLGPKSFAVAARCASEEKNTDNFKVFVVDNDPDETFAGKVVQVINTGSKKPVTLPVMSISMITFVVKDDVKSTAYVWQLDKDFAEVAAFPIKSNDIGYTYQDLPQFGYTWRIGDWVRYRSGSEDLSKGKDFKGAVSEPMIAGEDMLIPTYDGLSYVSSVDDKQYDIDVDLAVSKAYAFSGKTVAGLDKEGVIRAYA